MSATKRMRVHSEVRSITPGIAKRLLEDSPKNRPISEYAIAQWLRAMMEGEWVVGDPILMDEEGLLLDGHHRMIALTRYGKPVKFLVISGINRDEYWGRGNRQRSRTAAHALFEHKIENHNAVAGVAYRVLAWEVGMRPPEPRHLPPGQRFTDFEIANRALMEPDIERMIREMPRCRGLISPSTQGFLFWLFSQTDETHAKCFFEDLRNGESLPHGDPVLVLRNKLIAAKLESRRKRSRLDDAMVMAWTIRAWNASLQGAKLSLGSLRWQRGTAFPEPGRPKKLAARKGA